MILLNLMTLPFAVNTPLKSASDIDQKSFTRSHIDISRAGSAADLDLKFPFSQTELKSLHELRTEHNIEERSEEDDEEVERMKKPRRKVKLSFEQDDQPHEETGAEKQKKSDNSQPQKPKKETPTE